MDRLDENAAVPATEKPPFGLYALRQIGFAAIFAALFVVLGSVTIPIGPVPITLQTFGVMVVGGLLGARIGFASILLVVALAAAGLPVLHGKGGIPYMLGPTGGFIFSFPIAALLIGWASDRLYAGRVRLNRPRTILLFAAIAAFGVAVPYLFGVPWLAHRAGLDLAGALKAGCLPFLPGDAAKAVAATFVIAAARPFVPKLRPDR